MIFNYYLLLTCFLIVPISGCCAVSETQIAIGRGKEFQKNNLFDKAAAEYLRAADLITNNDPAKAELLLLAGECQNYKNGGLGKETFSKILDLKMATENQKNNARLKIAYCLFRDGDYKPIVADMEFLIAQNAGLSPAQQAEAYAYLGKAYFRLKEPSKAVIASRKAIACKELPLNRRLELSSRLAGYYLYQEKLSIPETYEKLVKDVGGQDFLAWQGILSIFTGSRKFEQSNEICNKIIAAPDSSPTARQYALMFQVQNLFGLKRYEETIIKGNQLLAEHHEFSNEEYFAIRMCIGTAMVRLRHYDDAVAEFTKIQALNTLYFSQLAQMMTGHCYLEQKKYDAALEAFSAVKELASLNSYVELLEQANHQIEDIKKIQEDNSQK